MALLEGFREDGSIRGLFGNSSDEEGENSGEKRDIVSNDRYHDNNEENEEEASGSEFFHFRSCLADEEILLETQKRKGIAHQMWPASVLFCRFMEEHPDLLPHPCRTSVIELGAGVGLCGLFMSRILHCRQCVLTDLAEALPLLRQNIAHNCTNDEFAISALELCWGREEDYVQALGAIGWTFNTNDDNPQELLIVAADCVYWESLYDIFFQTLHYFTSLGKNVRVIYSHVRRWKKENKFFNLCKKHLHVEVLYECVEMVAAPVSGQDDEDSTSSKCDLGVSDQDVPKRRQITRVYQMTAKIS